MYREDHGLEGIPFFDGNGRYVEEQVMEVVESGFFVPCKIEYHNRLKTPKSIDSLEVKAIAVGHRYMHGMLTDWEVLYFLNCKNRELNAVALRDLVDIQKLDK
jgi:hypothetical protein